VEVTFNEKHRLEMMFDTGASGTLITAATASKLALRVQGSGYATLADGRKSPFFVAPVRSVYAGNTRPKMLMVAISNTADIGLLGQDFFGDFDIKIRLNSIELHPR
jgi:predicted aspartyl protease